MVSEMAVLQRNDIVRLQDHKFNELKGKLWFNDNAFMISEVGEDGKVYLDELNEPVLANDLQQMPISKKQAGNIYYDPIIAASVVRIGDEIPVHSTDYSYFMDSFERVIEPDGTTMRSQIEKKGFKYVHEVQHWLRERFGSDDLRIHHNVITMAEYQLRSLWMLRDKLLESGVSSYQFLYEMANMMYLRWLSFYNDKDDTLWKELEQTTGDDLLDKYQKAINRVKQQTRIYSASVLAQAINEVSRCAKKENIAEVFDLMLQENSRMKDGGTLQNFTPKILVQLLVETMQPQKEERWHDPAAGFAGFLVEIDDYLKSKNDNYRLLSEKEKAFQLLEAISGNEIHKEIAWIGHCNTRFHGLSCEIRNGDSLTTVDYRQYDGIICEPPLAAFSLIGKDKANSAKRNRLTAFVELILNSLSCERGSRAALLLPESFFWNSAPDYRNTRMRLFEESNVNTVLRLPQGIYPVTTISMCALFLDRDRGVGNGILVYDMRSEKAFSQQGNQNALFKGFLKAFRSRVPDKKCSIKTLNELRRDDYRFDFFGGRSNEQTQIETSSHYLAEAKKTVKEISHILTIIEREVNG